MKILLLILILAGCGGQNRGPRVIDLGRLDIVISCHGERFCVRGSDGLSLESALALTRTGVCRLEVEDYGAAIAEF